MKRIKALCRSPFVQTIFLALSLVLMMIAIVFTLFASIPNYEQIDAIREAEARKAMMAERFDEHEKIRAREERLARKQAEEYKAEKEAEMEAEDNAWNKLYR